MDIGFDPNIKFESYDDFEQWKAGIKPEWHEYLVLTANGRLNKKHLNVIINSVKPKLPKPPKAPKMPKIKMPKQQVPEQETDEEDENNDFWGNDEIEYEVIEEPERPAPSKAKGVSKPQRPIKPNHTQARDNKVGMNTEEVDALVEKKVSALLADKKKQEAFLRLEAANSEYTRLMNIMTRRRTMNGK